MKFFIFIFSFIFSSITLGETLDDISQFAESICGEFKTKGSIESSELKTAIKGQINPKVLSKFLGVKVLADGSYSIKGKTYDGFPYDSLPEHISDVLQCKKEIAFMFIEERKNIKDSNLKVKKTTIKLKNDSLQRAKFLGDIPSQLQVYGGTLPAGKAYYRFSVLKPSVVNFYVEKLSNPIKLELLTREEKLISGDVYDLKRKTSWNNEIKDELFLPGEYYYIAVSPFHVGTSTAFKLTIQGVDVDG